EHKGIAIYDNGVPRPVQTPDNALDSRVMIAFGLSPGRLYAYSLYNYQIGFRRLAVDASGVRYVDSSPALREFGFDMTVESGLLYSSSGVVLDPEGLSLVGTYAASPALQFYDTLVVPDSEVGRVYFLT